MAEVWSDGVSAPATGEGQIARSRRLTATAWELVRRDRTLQILTALSVAFGVAAIGALFWAAGWLGGSQSVGRLVVTLLVAAWPFAFVTTMLNVAIAASVGAVLDGRRLSMREALTVSLKWIDQIAQWALLATVVGAVLQQLGRRRPLRGRSTSWILGPPWVVVSVFAVPMLALEGGTATGCYARSSALVRERWGTGVRGSVVGSEAMAAVGAAAGGLIGVGVATAGGPETVLLGVGLLGAMVVGGIALCAQQVFAVVLYRYAVTGEAAGGFALADLQAPFSPRWPARAT
jgi:hypothetical protein